MSELTETTAPVIINEAEGDNHSLQDDSVDGDATIQQQEKYNEEVEKEETKKEDIEKGNEHEVEVVKEDEKKEDVVVTYKQQLQKLVGVPYRIIVRIVIWTRERIQQTIDLTVNIFKTSTNKVKVFINKPVIRKMVTGAGVIAVTGVCVYTFGYIPYSYVKQSRSLSFH